MLIISIFCNISRESMHKAKDHSKLYHKLNLPTPATVVMAAAANTIREACRLLKNQVWASCRMCYIIYYMSVLSNLFCKLCRTLELKTKSSLNKLVLIKVLNMMSIEQENDQICHFRSVYYQCCWNSLRN